MLTYCCSPSMCRTLPCNSVCFPPWLGQHGNPASLQLFFHIKKLNQYYLFLWPPYCTASEPMSECQSPDLELVGVRVHRLYLTVQRVVLSVQWMLLAVLTGLHHLHCDLNVTQRLPQKNMSLHQCTASHVCHQAHIRTERMQ